MLRLLDHTALGFVKRERLTVVSSKSVLQHFRWEMTAGDVVVAAQDDGATNDVLELPNVAGVVVLQQQFRGFRVDFKARASRTENT